MTRFDQLDRALASWMDDEARAPAPPSLAASVIDATGRHRPRRAWRSALRQPGAWLGAGQLHVSRRVPLLLLVGLIVVATLGGALYVGSPAPADPVPQRPAALITDETPPPVSEPAPSPLARELASPEAFAGPCAAMLQRFAMWSLDDATGPIPAGDAAPGASGVLLMTTLGDSAVGQSGQPILGGFDVSSDPLAIVGPPMDGEERARPFARGFSISPLARIVASPDGRAIAVEDGDLGQAGCGDPIVLPIGGGLRRPFESGAFQLVTDLAWAPDGSALYAVRRPTIDAEGRSLHDPASGDTVPGPGTLLRWDTATGEVAELGTPCVDCPLGRPIVSPDGVRVAVATGSRGIALLDAAGSWTTVTDRGGGLRGWADDETLVVQGMGDDTQSWDGLMNLDGVELVRWEPVCCHETGYGGPLSPDGTTMAGMTLSSDALSWRVTLLDVRTGSTREVWAAPEARGCTSFRRGSTGRAECEATTGAAPGSTPDPTTSISGYSRVEAWAPDGSAVVVIEQVLDRPEVRVRIVRVDGSGATAPVTVPVPDLSATLGFPNIGPAVSWLPGSP